MIEAKLPETDIIDWNECEEKFIRKVDVDLERIKSIVKKAKDRLGRARNTEEKPENISFIVEDYYEVIKEMLVAYLLKNGLRARNHQCLISFFYKSNPGYEKEAYIITQLSFFRNRLDYYGEDVPKEFLEKNKKEFERIIEIIENILKENENTKHEK